LKSIQELVFPRDWRSNFSGIPCQSLSPQIQGKQSVGGSNDPVSWYLATDRARPLLNPQAEEIELGNQVPDVMRLLDDGEPPSPNASRQKKLLRIAAPKQRMMKANLRLWGQHRPRSTRARGLELLDLGSGRIPGPGAGT